MFKEQKGITLVALIITIIVMLILAGVSISLVVGENGVMTQAQNAGDSNVKGALRDAISMASADMVASFYSNTSNYGGTGGADLTVAGAKIEDKDDILAIIQRNFKGYSNSITIAGSLPTDPTVSTDLTLTIGGLQNTDENTMVVTCNIVKTADSQYYTISAK